MTISLVSADAFTQYRNGLYALLKDAVDGGASLGFLADFSRKEADHYLDQIQSGLDAANHCLWIAQGEGQMLGSVQLGLCTKANGLNRAEIQKLMVHHSVRRRGLASQLLQELERHAHHLKRGLLYLDTEAQSPAEAFYRQQGYQFIGGLPDYACGPDGQYRANAIYYKTLSRPQP